MTPANLALAVDNTADAIKSEALSWPDRAASLTVTDPQTYEAGTGLLKAIKALRNRIAETFDPHVRRAHEAHKALVAEKAAAEAPLTQAETVIKRALVAYTEAEEKRRREEERRLAEEARKAEEARRLEEAAALEVEALATGDTEMLATAQEVIAAPVQAPVVVLPTQRPKVAGISYRTIWRYRIVNEKLIPREYLIVDEKAIGAIVRGREGKVTIPGVEVYSETVASASGR